MNCFEKFTKRAKLLLLLVLYKSSSVHTFSPSEPGKTAMFTITNFNLPVEMVFSTDNNVRVQVPTIQKNKEEAQKIVDGFLTRRRRNTVSSKMTRLQAYAVQNLNEAVLSRLLNQD
ncbi:hypothetical protein KIN20_032955 [Parelaphostrongylus tenuis]|uniref:Uncharacterized protein n=1 Tax=Parelaphostrongylus tenuis TaxID=148309 RepID=A0AAD5R7S0_PARTN|nr:hypothetical protein KIN20_032955 [Parelaphostrongylus tenuis]